MKYTNLTLATLDKSGHSRTCNYWYLVQSNGTAHIAFTTREALIVWLRLRGLELTQDLPEHGQHSYQKIRGEYSKQSHGWTHEFNALPAVYESKGLSNGDYTLMKFTVDNGIVTEHHLNPNCEHRPVYNYAECREIFC